MKTYNFLKTRKIQFKPKNLFTLPLLNLFVCVPVFAGTTFNLTISGSNSASGTIDLDTENVIDNTNTNVVPNFVNSFDLNVNGTTFTKDDFRGFWFQGFSNIDWSAEVLTQVSDFNIFSNSGPNGFTTKIFRYDNDQYTFTSFLVGSSDDGDATYSISGQTYAGKTLTAGVSSNDPDGNGSVTSYTWQSSSDGSSWTTVGTSSTYILTTSEEGKYIRVTVAYTDGEGTSESVTASSITISQLHTEWVQPYTAMQNIGLGSIKNNRDLVLAKAGECNNYGWVIGDTDYCVYTNANNTTASVNGNSLYGGYDYAKFNTSINLEKTINDRWKAGVAYGVGSSNLDNYNFSSTTASLSSTNTHYSIYGVKKVSDKFTLKGMIGGSDFDYKGNRNYSTTSATSAYDTDGYTAEINGTWDIKKNIKNMKTPIRLQPNVGVAYAALTQDGFSESGSGDLITLESNQAESLLLKTGINIDKQIPMEGGKWILVPSIALNYEMDPYADDDHRSIKGGLTESSTAHTKVSSKTLGQHNGSIKVGADFILSLIHI